MNLSRSKPAVALLALAAAASAHAPALAASHAEKHPFTVMDMLAMQRVSDPQPSPDGSKVLFALRTTDLEANAGRWDLWLVNADGSGLRQLTTHKSGDTNGRWSPDGRSIYFLSSRSGTSQIWKLAIDGGEAAQVSNLPLDVANLEVTPDGSRFVFSLEVFPDCAGDLSCTTKKLEEIETRLRAAEADRSAAAARLAEGKAGATATAIAVAEARVAEAAAIAEIARIDLEDATIKAPFDGVITRRYRSVGDYVNPAPFIEVLELVSDRDLEAEFTVPEHEFAQLVSGETEVSLSASMLESTITTRAPAVRVACPTRDPRDSFGPTSGESALRPWSIRTACAERDGADAPASSPRRGHGISTPYGLAGSVADSATVTTSSDSSRALRSTSIAPGCANCAAPRPATK